MAFLDSDDLWQPEKLEKQVSFMMENGYHFSYHEYMEIDEASQPIGVYVSGIRRVNKFAMYTCNWIGCLTVMYDAEKVGLIQIGDVKKHNDSAMWLQVIQKADCYLLKENLAQYRRRKGSITPPSLKDRISCRYVLFRDHVTGHRITATFLLLLNLVGAFMKKVFFVRRCKVD